MKGTYTALLSGMKSNYRTALGDLRNAQVYLQDIFDKADRYFGMEVSELALIMVPFLIVLMPGLLNRVKARGTRPRTQHTCVGCV